MLCTHALPHTRMHTHTHKSTRVHMNAYISDSVLSKTAIFPKKEGRKREIPNESARGSSLREANV